MKSKVNYLLITSVIILVACNTGSVPYNQGYVPVDINSPDGQGDYPQHYYPRPHPYHLEILTIQDKNSIAINSSFPIYIRLNNIEKNKNYQVLVQIATNNKQIKSVFHNGESQIVIPFNDSKELQKLVINLQQINSLVTADLKYKNNFDKNYFLNPTWNNLVQNYVNFTYNNFESNLTNKNQLFIRASVADENTSETVDLILNLIS